MATTALKTRLLRLVLPACLLLLGGVGVLLWAKNHGRSEVIVHSVARWQNLTPSFPWIAPGWRARGPIQGKKGINFCSVT